MFSIKEINKTSRAFGYIEDVKAGKAKEVLYFTNQQRDGVVTEELIAESASEIAEYQGADGALDPKYQYKILPCTEFIDGFERDAVYCCGGPGSGKTWQIASYIENYHAFHPDNDVFYISANNIENDKSLERVLGLKRVDLKTGKDERVLKQVNLLSIEHALDHKDYNNTLFIFDDIIDVKPSVKPSDLVSMLSDEEKKKFRGGATLKDREDMENHALKKMKRCVGYIRDSVDNILRLGRKNRLSIIIVDHQLNSGKTTFGFITQCSSFWLFPYANNSVESLKTWLRGKISFSKGEAETIAELPFYQYDFLFINKLDKKFAMTPDRLVIF
jgi:hypothetical protein